jgi:glucose-1-phosphate adenylyltransferase
MARQRVLALIMAGGAGGRMGVLTEARAKPALPYGGVYSLIDFPLSNCLHSGITNVWVIEQFQPKSLNDHLANGRPWDLDRTYGGLQVIAPYQGSAEGGWHQGNADALYRNRRFIRDFDPDVLLVLSADHVYTLDYDAAIARHRETGAEATIVTTSVPPHESASRFGNVRVGQNDQVTAFAYKPSEPLGDIITTEVFVYDPPTLLRMIDELVAEQQGQHNGKGDDKQGGEVALSDFGDELLPRLVARGRTYAYALDGYWRDVGTITAYWRSHMDLLDDEPGLRLDDRNWPIRSFGQQRMPARIASSAHIHASLISPGCVVRGQVERSVLGPGVVVEAGAVLREAVILDDAYIAADTHIERAVIDAGARIGRGARIGGVAEHEGQPAIAVVGMDVQLGDGERVEAGAQLEPASDR